MKSMRKEITSRACPNSTCPKVWYEFGHLLLGYLPHSLLIYLLAIMYVSGSGVQDTQGPRFLPGAYPRPICSVRFDPFCDLAKPVGGIISIL